MEKSDALLSRKIRENHPELYERYKLDIQRPRLVFTHYSRLPVLRDSFCKFKKIPTSDLVGIKKPTDYKTKFIAAVIQLYNPEVITGYDDKMKDRLCEELSDILNCKREAVSTQAQTIRVMMNPARNLTAYQEFKKEITEISEYLQKAFGHTPSQEN
jgi:hypothetical protein